MLEVTGLRVKLLKPIRVQMTPVKVLGDRREATGFVCLVLLGFGLALVFPCSVSVPLCWNGNVYFTPMCI